MAGARRCAAGRGLAAPRGQARGTPAGVEASAKERFAHVDIAEAGDDALVHQERLEVGLFPDGAARKISCVEFLAQGLDAQPLEESVMLEVALGDQGHVAETPHIIVGDHRPAGHGEHQVIVLVEMAVVMNKLTKERAVTHVARALSHQEASGHAQVHGQNFGAIEVHKNVFRAPIEVLHPSSR